MMDLDDRGGRKRPAFEGQEQTHELEDFPAHKKFKSEAVTFFSLPTNLKIDTLARLPPNAILGVATVCREWSSYIISVLHKYCVLNFQLAWAPRLLKDLLRVYNDSGIPLRQWMAVIASKAELFRVRNEVNAQQPKGAEGWSLEAHSMPFGQLQYQFIWNDAFYLIWNESLNYSVTSRKQLASDNPTDECDICKQENQDDLILCDGCPKMFHPACLGIRNLPDSNYFCSDCKVLTDNFNIKEAWFSTSFVRPTKEVADTTYNSEGDYESSDFEDIDIDETVPTEAVSEPSDLDDFDSDQIDEGSEGEGGNGDHSDEGEWIPEKKKGDLAPQLSPYPHAPQLSSAIYSGGLPDYSSQTPSFAPQRMMGMGGPVPLQSAPRMGMGPGGVPTGTQAASYYTQPTPPGAYPSMNANPNPYDSNYLTSSQGSESQPYSPSAGGASYDAYQSKPSPYGGSLPVGGGSQAMGGQSNGYPMAQKSAYPPTAMGAGSYPQPGVGGNPGLTKPGTLPPLQSILGGGGAQVSGSAPNPYGPSTTSPSPYGALGAGSLVGTSGQLGSSLGGSQGGAPGGVSSIYSQQSLQPQSYNTQYPGMGYGGAMPQPQKTAAHPSTYLSYAPTPTGYGPIGAQPTMSGRSSQPQKESKSQSVGYGNLELRPRRQPSNRIAAMNQSKAVVRGATCFPFSSYGVPLSDEELEIIDEDPDAKPNTSKAGHKKVFEIVFRFWNQQYGRLSYFPRAPFDHNCGALWLGPTLASVIYADVTEANVPVAQFITSRAPKSGAQPVSTKPKRESRAGNSRTSSGLSASGSASGMMHMQQQAAAEVKQHQPKQEQMQQMHHHQPAMSMGQMSSMSSLPVTHQQQNITMQPLQLHQVDTSSALQLPSSSSLTTYDEPITDLI